MRHMEIYVGLALFVVLVAVLIAARRAHRRQKLLRRGPRKTLSKKGIGKVSARSDMRAYNDTTTLMDAVARVPPPAPRPAPPPDRNPDTVRRKPS